MPFWLRAKPQCIYYLVQTPPSNRSPALTLCARLRHTVLSNSSSGIGVRLPRTNASHDIVAYNLFIHQFTPRHSVDTLSVTVQACSQIQLLLDGVLQDLLNISTVDIVLSWYLRFITKLFVKMTICLRHWTRQPFRSPSMHPKYFDAIRGPYLVLFACIEISLTNKRGETWIQLFQKRRLLSPSWRENILYVRLRNTCLCVPNVSFLLREILDDLAMGWCGGEHCEICFSCPDWWIDSPCMRPLHIAYRRVHQRVCC